MEEDKHENTILERRSAVKEKMITVPVTATRDSSGNMVYEYITIPVRLFETWLKHCFKLSGEH